MDNFINLAKKGYTAYQESQSNVSKTSGSEYNSPHHSGQDGPRTESYSPDIDHDEVVHAAQKHGSGSSDLFASALGFLGANKDKHTDPVNEDEVINAHKKVYEDGDTSNLSAHSIGSAAALQVLKQATSSSSSKASGNTQTQIISMAMAEATKIFDKAGGQGNKQEAVNGAAMTVMKLLVQSKLGGSPFGGGGNSGGLGGLLSLASKFT